MAKTTEEFIAACEQFVSDLRQGYYLKCESFIDLIRDQYDSAEKKGSDALLPLTVYGLLEGGMNADDLSCVQSLFRFSADFERQLTALGRLGFCVTTVYLASLSVLKMGRAKITHPSGLTQLDATYFVNDSLDQLKNEDIVKIVEDNVSWANIIALKPHPEDILQQRELAAVVICKLMQAYSEYFDTKFFQAGEYKAVRLAKTVSRHLKDPISYWNGDGYVKPHHHARWDSLLALDVAFRSIEVFSEGFFSDTSMLMKLLQNIESRYPMPEEVGCFLTPLHEWLTFIKDQCSMTEIENVTFTAELEKKNDPLSGGEDEENSEETFSLSSISVDIFM